MSTRVMAVGMVLFRLFLKVASIWSLSLALASTPRGAALGERQSVLQRTAKHNQPLSQAIGLVCHCSSNLRSAANRDGSGLVVLAQHIPPSPAPIPPNASHITAIVLTDSPAPLQSSTPSILADATLRSLTVAIYTSEPVATDLGSLARPGTVIQAFSAESLGPEVVGQKIVATVQLTGDTQHSRWMISHVQRLLP